MHILFLTPQIPYPPRQGAGLRNYYVMKGVAQQHTVSLLSFQDADQATDDTIAPLRDLCAHLHTHAVPPRTTADRLRQMVTTRYPDMGHRLYADTFAQRLAQLLTDHDIDIVQIEGIELARYMETIRTVTPQVKIVFDNHNAETELQRRAFRTDLYQPRRWPAAVYSAVQVGRLARFERWACRTADGVTAVSAADADHLARLMPLDARSPIPIPNSIDVDAYAAPADADTAEQKFDLVFTGKMDYRPNVDAIRWFASDIWPQIIAARPETTLAVVGQKPTAEIRALGDQHANITVTGFVESVRPYIVGANVFLMPLRMGSGTRLKFIQAMAAGKAIVSTAVGAEGFNARSGEHYRRADTAAEMATAVLALLHRPEEGRALAAAAQTFARQYDWRTVTPRFSTLYEQIAAVDHPPR